MSVCPDHYVVEEKEFKDNSIMQYLQVATQETSFSFWVWDSWHY